MGKHYSIEFKHHIIKLVLEEHWGIREVVQHFHIATHSSVVVRFALKNTVSMGYIVNLPQREKQKCQSEKKRHFAIILKISKRY
ncbi:hypothetical protein [Aggregatibacter actinomycetemcomitans]|uniref:hypothetical protein n=1 Tax=Aggregatibacter actinomycetemcomitans TaxID=714 RepID=UPI00030047B5|nr:hypothetical protein [Aggregatibacter actinomycetemcomitans]